MLTSLQQHHLNPIFKELGYRQIYMTMKQRRFKPIVEQIEVKCCYYRSYKAES